MTRNLGHHCLNPLTQQQGQRWEGRTESVLYILVLQIGSSDDLVVIIVKTILKWALRHSEMVQTYRRLGLANCLGHLQPEF